MTNATMKLVSVAVTCKDKLETPEQKLEDGESITIRVVELAKFNQTLKGKRSPSTPEVDLMQDGL